MRLVRVIPMVVLSALGCACPGVSPAGTDGGSDAGAEVDGGTTTPPPDAGSDAGVDAGSARDPLVEARPFAEVVPVSYVAGTPMPLVVLLHGYTATGQSQDAYFRLSALAQQRGFLLALPDGTVDGNGQHFWNATDACCGFGQSTVDDVAYLTAVINDMRRRYTVDPKRIFLVGHSNGGFMSHRMACDRAELIAGIVSLAGAVWNDASQCRPSGPVNVLQVHGTLDAVIRYGGGVTTAGAPPYPSAEQTVTTWANKNGCTGASLTPIGGNLDLVGALSLAETERSQFTGCPAGAAAELWTIRAGDHVPAFNSNWGDTIFTWLMAHPRP